MLIVVKDDHSSHTGEAAGDPPLDPTEETRSGGAPAASPVRTQDWEELARREPYFALLTNEGLLGVAGNTNATTAFFDTGEADVTALLAAITSVLGRDLIVTCALDFGCGAGRLTLPLARRALRVVACDIAPAMLAHARQNAESVGLRNVTFIKSEELAGLSSGEFDFICSLLVFQHIPPSVGYELIRILVTLLAPGGVAALQVMFRRPTHTLRRLARLRARSRPDRRMRGVLRGEHRRLPDAQMNEYDERSVIRHIEAAGAHLVARLPTHHGETTGAVIIIKKPLSTQSPD